jgi:hypothetical protein
MERRAKVELFEEIRREHEFGIGTIKRVARKRGSTAGWCVRRWRAPSGRSASGRRASGRQWGRDCLAKPARYLPVFMDRQWRIALCGDPFQKCVAMSP